LKTIQIGSDSLRLARPKLSSPPGFWSKLRLLLCLSAGLGISGCTTTSQSHEFGMQPGHVGYVPARIAIVPCQDWPTGARFASLPLSNLKDIERAALCESFNQFVIEGFTGQPYMRGYSPSY